MRAVSTANSSYPREGRPYPGQQRRAHREERDQHRHPGLLAGERGGNDGDEQRTEERGDLVLRFGLVLSACGVTLGIG
jgi:hypothetical protein